MGKFYQDVATTYFKRRVRSRIIQQKEKSKSVSSFYFSVNYLIGIKVLYLMSLTFLQMVVVSGLMLMMMKKHQRTLKNGEDSVTLKVIHETFLIDWVID